MADNLEKLKDISVGKILYILNSQKVKVFPVQVIEIVETKSLTMDKKILYMISTDKNDAGPLHDLSKIDGEIYLTIDEVYNAMKQNALNAIDRLIANVKEKEKVCFFDTSTPIENNDNSK